MAGIDKIYGTQEQYDEFKSWLEEANPKLLRFLYDKDGYEGCDARPIANFPTSADVWLWKHCQIKFIRDRLMWQYEGSPWDES